MSVDPRITAIGDRITELLETIVAAGDDDLRAVEEASEEIAEIVGTLATRWFTIHPLVSQLGELYPELGITGALYEVVNAKRLPGE